MSLATSKRVGESVESAVIQAVPELTPVADRDAHVDAEVVTTIDPWADLPTVTPHGENIARPATDGGEDGGRS